MTHMHLDWDALKEAEEDYMLKYRHFIVACSPNMNGSGDNMPEDWTDIRRLRWALKYAGSIPGYNTVNLVEFMDDTLHLMDMQAAFIRKHPCRQGVKN